MDRSKHWAVIPAAGTGMRMGAEIPKQYLLLRGRPVIEHTLNRFCNHPRIKGVVVAIAPEDRWWTQVRVDTGAPLFCVRGGAERCHSVIHGLQRLSSQARPNDWVLVHDAVRPCVQCSDIERLMDEIACHPVGGLLGLRVRDTMKRTDSRGDVQETVNRNGLWHALTPQMFRIEPLANALRACIERGLFVTDEAQAMELSGARPHMVEGREDNIKITRPQDMVLAELYLANQEGVG